VNFESIDNTYDGGFIIAGNYVGMESYNNEKLFVRKLSSDLSDQWHFIMDLEGVKRRLISIRTIIQTADKGFLVTMDTQNMEEEDSISGNKWPDLWLIKLSETGDIEWQKTYGGVESERMIHPGPYVFETAGGNIYLIGNSLSFYNSNGISTWDVWVLKLFSNGDIQWQRRYDGGKGDFANSALMTPENGLIICGSTYSSANTSKEESSFLLFKISPDGEIQWQRAYAYSEDSNEMIRTLCQTHDGKIVFVGRTGIFFDAVLMKVSETGYLNILGCTLKYLVDLKAINTNVVPKNTFVKKKEISNSSIQTHIENVDINFFKRTICWNFIKPPLDVSFEQEFNRGLFGGEALNYVKWNPNPKNSGFSVDQYLVYRKEFSLGDAGYELIATVPAGVYEYVDNDVLLEDKFDYVVTAVDTEGRESAWSRSKAKGN